MNGLASIPLVAAQDGNGLHNTSDWQPPLLRLLLLLVLLLLVLRFFMELAVVVIVLFLEILVVLFVVIIVVGFVFLLQQVFRSGKRHAFRKDEGFTVKCVDVFVYLFVFNRVFVPGEERLFHVVGGKHNERFFLFRILFLVNSA